MTLLFIMYSTDLLDNIAKVHVSVKQLYKSMKTT